MTEKDWLNKAAKYCARRETCEFDMRRKLQQWGASGDVINSVIDGLKQMDFINHRRYAEAFANDKVRFDRWGKMKIRYALEQKQIEPEFIDRALEGIDDSLYEQTLKDVLQAKMRSLSHEDPAFRQKLVNYAARKGFEFDLINKLLDQMLN